MSKRHPLENATPEELREKAAIIHDDAMGFITARKGNPVEIQTTLAHATTMLMWADIREFFSHLNSLEGSSDE